MKITASLGVAAILSFSSSAFAAGNGPDWGYAHHGDDWAGLTDDGVHFPYEACGEGKEQSPIDIITVSTINNGSASSLTTNYSSTPINVENNGHTVQVNFAPGSTLKVGSKTYHLLQFHFHAGSENTVDGHRSATEVHFVHMDSEGSLGVLGVLIEEGEENPALEAILSTEHLGDKGKHEIHGTINALDLLPSKNINEYYNFPGSLTTPPCTEGVNWFIAKTSITGSAGQIEALSEKMWHHGHENYRYTQDLNDRIVTEKSH